jgi:hypothetical protein
MSPRRAPGRDRTHLTPGRPRAVLLRYTNDEYAEVADAARCAGLTPSGYAAEAALAAASGQAAPTLRPERAALAELMRARGQVRKLGSNVNQAARQLNAIGEAPEWLERAVVAATRAVTELEAAAVAMTTATRRRSTVRHQLSDTTADMATSQERTAAADRADGRTPAADNSAADNSAATESWLARQPDFAALSTGHSVDAMPADTSVTTGRGERRD